MRYIPATTFLALLAVTVPVAAQSAPDPSPAQHPFGVRLSLGPGILYVHRTAFTFERPGASPTTRNEPASDQAAIMLGGAIEVGGRRWWGAVGGALSVVTPFDEGATRTASLVAGPRFPRVMGGEFRAGLGPVLVSAQRRERNLLGQCGDGRCRFPPDLVTGGVGLVLAQQWQPWRRAAVGLEGQAASGAQRFLGARLFVQVGG